MGSSCPRERDWTSLEELLSHSELTLLNQHQLCQRTEVNKLMANGPSIKKEKKRNPSSVKRCQRLKLSAAHFNNNNINIKGWLGTPALMQS